MNAAYFSSLFSKDHFGDTFLYFFIYFRNTHTSTPTFQNIKCFMLNYSSLFRSWVCLKKRYGLHDIHNLKQTTIEREGRQETGTFTFGSLTFSWDFQAHQHHHMAWGLTLFSKGRQKANRLRENQLQQMWLISLKYCASYADKFTTNCLTQCSYWAWRVIHCNWRWNTLTL